MILLQLIFWICLFLVFYSYIIFPVILQLLARKTDVNPQTFTADDVPAVSVLIAAYNEESVIEEKISSLLKCDYPNEKLEILVGSDASSDRTNTILKKLADANPSLYLSLFEERVGKPGIINRLAKKAGGEILVITDANVMLEHNTLFELVRYFRSEQIGLVDSMLISTGIKSGGISLQERFYTNREVNIKHHESLLWGTMMGPFGGCYAVRKSLYTPVPDHFLVDDFYINMAVLEQGAECISNLQARVYEDVSNNPGEQFKRKKRISAGNYQNMQRFFPMLYKGRGGTGFCFFSHKIVRWIVPFLVLMTLASSLILGVHSLLYLIMALLQLMVLLIPIIDHILRKIGIQSIPLRFISHFVLMNIAILAGFFRFLGGIKNNVWQPTSRNQD